MLLYYHIGSVSKMSLSSTIFKWQPLKNKNNCRKFDHFLKTCPHKNTILKFNIKPWYGVSIMSQTAPAKCKKLLKGKQTDKCITLELTESISIYYSWFQMMSLKKHHFMQVILSRTSFSSFFVPLLPFFKMKQTFFLRIYQSSWSFFVEITG